MLKSIARNWWLPALVLLALALAAWINLPRMLPVFDRSDQRVAALPAALPFTSGQRVLFLAPHPDDETLCCGGMIQQAQAAGATAYIAWITAGDGFEFDAALMDRAVRPSPAQMRDLGQTRAREAGRAAAILGVPAARTFMLGYPDGGLFYLFTTNYDQPYRARHTGASAVYVDGALTPGAPFTGRNLHDDLARVLDTVKPDVVLVPAPQDAHPDHHTLTYMMLRLVGERQQEPTLHFWVVHGGLEWPLPKGLHETLPLTVPPRATGLPWERVALTPEQVQVKWQAIRAYRTQTEVLGRFMEAFARANELVSPSPLPPLTALAENKAEAALLVSGQMK
ncbi:PIG-L deacetylase family protein [Deinococcus marmoris]|uniref:PIG-L family deacetylase n=1 Tax=Deinococcus marmoris TaxID=249408 RepID=A0A1U7NY29_9DEIO|nr:PIG-L deacetylase family protein [Deinococcus marmoris]OLV17826.1 hypothetical protein BOO71_0007627 [Deinococcus marmoris]